MRLNSIADRVDDWYALAVTFYFYCTQTHMKRIWRRVLWLSRVIVKDGSINLRKVAVPPFPFRPFPLKVGP